MTEDTSPENLRKFLESDDPALVKMGISLAKGLGVEVTIKDLERFLKISYFDPDPAKKVKIGIMLADEAGIVDEAMEMLCKRRKGVVALVDIGDARAIEPLIKALKNKEWRVRWNGAWALGKIGDASDPPEHDRLHSPRAVEPLIKTLDDEKDDVRWGAACSLGRVIGDGREIEPLIKALEDGDWRVCCGAAEALGKIGDARAVESLIKVLEGDFGTFANAAEEVDRHERRKLGHEVVENIRWYVAWSLGEIGDARAVEPLIKEVELGFRTLTNAAKEALEKLGHEV